MPTDALQFLGLFLKILIHLFDFLIAPVDSSLYGLLNIRQQVRGRVLQDALLSVVCRNGAPAQQGFRGMHDSLVRNYVRSFWCVTRLLMGLPVGVDKGSPAYGSLYRYIGPPWPSW